MILADTKQTCPLPVRLPQPMSLIASTVPLTAGCNDSCRVEVALAAPQCLSNP